jgi:hypothetical protein
VRVIPLEEVRVSVQVDDDNYQDALVRLRGILENLRSSGSLDAIAVDRQAVHGRFGPRFQIGALDKLDSQTFLDFLRFKQNRHWSSIHRHGGRMVADMPRLRSALALLLDEAQPLGERVPRALSMVNGLGLSAASPILHVAAPDRYAVWNERTIECAKELGIWPDPSTADKVASYPAANELLIRIARDLGIDLWTLDSLWDRMGTEADVSSIAVMEGVTPSFLLAWNPAKYEWTPAALADLRARHAKGERLRDTWSTGNSKQLKPGDRFYLIRLGDGPRGIFASGRILSEVREGPHFAPERAAAGETRRYVEIRYDELLNPWTDGLLTQAALVEQFKEVEWSPQSSGTRLPPSILFRLELLWQATLHDAQAGPIRLAVSVQEVRESAESFASAALAHHPSTRYAAYHPNYFVHDSASGAFIPAKWCAFVGMTPETYVALQIRQRTPGTARGFLGAKAHKSLEKVLGRTFASNDALRRALHERFERDFGKGVLANVDTSRLVFLDLPATGPNAAVPAPRKVEEESVGEELQRMETTMPKPPTNLVLYGPPGTGKTYQAIAEAVRLCDGVVPTERGSLNRRFRQLQETGRIEVVTFHQSYSYEEFVEGIRPEIKDNDDESAAASIGYSVRDGLFKRLCQTAQRVEARSPRREPGAMEVESARVWKMSLCDSTKPEEAPILADCFENGRIALGWGGSRNFKGATTKDAVFERIRADKSDIKLTDYEVLAVHTFHNVMQVGDLVVASEGLSKIRAIGRVTGDAYLAPDAGKAAGFSQLRPVEWLVQFTPSLPNDRILTKKFSQRTIYELSPPVLREEALRSILMDQRPGQRPDCVLVIDEINRGNVSKILGELITLLEPDKRLGMPNELMVRLPYSGEEFGVPAAVHVVGTMNTADRSIAFLDAALRRRFTFREILPDLDVLRSTVGKAGVVGSIDIAALLEAVNTRVEALYDRDHVIGHAYFLGCASLEDVRRVLVERIIPLLQEYFHDDWARLCAVLGCGYETGGEEPKTENKAPVIRAEALKAAALGAAVDDADAAVRFGVSPGFLVATGIELASYLRGIVQGA